MYNELIYYTDDVIKAYADKRLALTEPDVKDLLRCLTKFIGEEHNKKSMAAVRLPSLGYLYRIPAPRKVNVNSKATDFERRWIEELYNGRPIRKFKNYYDNWKKEDLQVFQNNIED